MAQPTPKQLAAMRAASADSSFINRADAEACVEHDWLEAQPGGGYRLTENGRRVLAQATAR